MRSQKLLELHQKLADLNKNYSHFLFIVSQFLIDNELKILHNQSSMIASEYNSNPYSSQFNRKLADLPKFHQETKGFILISIFILMYSQFEIYLEEIYEFVRQHNLMRLSKAQGAILNNVIQNFGISISEEVNQTLDYIRLRRNILVHQNHNSIKISQALRDIISNGEALNSYWQQSNLKVQILDFTKIDLIFFEDVELIDMLNIIRRLSEEIDEAILLAVDRGDLNQFLINQFTLQLNRKPKQYKTTQAALTIFKRYCKFNPFLYVELNDTELASLAPQIEKLYSKHQI